MRMNKRLLVLVGVLVVLIVVVGAYWRSTPMHREQPNSVVNKQPKIPGEKKDVGSEQLPKNFPADVPIEEGAAVVQNFNVDNNGYQQATRSFETRNTLAQNLALYKKYLTSNGYQISTTIDQPNYKMVYGTKGKESLRIEMTDNSVSKIKTVSISYIQAGSAN